MSEVLNENLDYANGAEEVELESFQVATMLF